MTEEQQKLIERIMAIRLGLLPPYCYDTEEEGVGRLEYWDFFAAAGASPALAASLYLQQLELLGREPDSPVASSELLDARRAMIEAIPFCRDDLERMPEGERQGAQTRMLVAYRHLATTGFIAETLREYRSLVLRLGAKHDPGQPPTARES